jgi:MoaA/NifB/PqqE/SkfB family radical SAM enzyme
MNTGCNARCRACEIWRQKIGSRLQADEIASWAPGWRRLGIGRIELCGEPTIHPQLETIIDGLRTHGFTLNILSNGLRLQPYLSQIREQAESLTVSLDGPPEIHDWIRGVANAFDRTEKNVRALRSSSPTFPIYGRCAVNRENLRYLNETVETAKKIGLTNISFCRLDTDTAAFGREQLENDDWSERLGALSLQIADTPLVDAVLDRLEAVHQDDFDSRYIVESPRMLRWQLSPALVTHANSGLTRGLRCNAPLMSVVVEPNGDVKPCWFLPAYGNLRKDSLERILDCAEAKSFRANLDVERNRVCQTCITPRVFDDAGNFQRGFPTQG